MTGAAMSTYTGALLAATSTPVWAALPKLLPAAFGASAMASAAAALSLLAGGSGSAKSCTVSSWSRARSNWRLVAMLPGKLRERALQHGSASRRCSRWPRRRCCIRSPEQSSGSRAGDTAARTRAIRFGKASAVAVLAGAFLLRHLVLRAGNELAKRPRDYFRFARPRLRGAMAADGTRIATAADRATRHRSRSGRARSRARRAIRLWRSGRGVALSGRVARPC